MAVASALSSWSCCNAPIGEENHRLTLNWFPASFTYAGWFFVYAKSVGATDLTDSCSVAVLAQAEPKFGMRNSPADGGPVASNTAAAIASSSSTGSDAARVHRGVRTAAATARPNAMVKPGTEICRAGGCWLSQQILDVYEHVLKAAKLRLGVSSVYSSSCAAVCIDR